ncbi:hypothetical protein F0562_002842 [Nyssa sinensis]|uniref:DUF632 domain-containing protein n=1 Tax=Nyssa sinensis TaxID=561372 RepID=A0A5J5BTY8_9ASTE|nr:hypothetical protein F0562_002842 [Nyssa sinensis]
MSSAWTVASQFPQFQRSDFAAQSLSACLLSFLLVFPNLALLSSYACSFCKEMSGGLLWFDEIGFCVVVVVIDMGCGGSKVDDLPLVIRCRERKELIKAAADHRYSLASAHLSYFRSLKDVGDALRRFVDEELVIASSSASPVLTLPSDEGKTKKKNKDSSSNDKSSSSSISISHNHSPGDDAHDLEDSHLHLSSGSDSELGSSSGHIHIHDSPEDGPTFSSPLPHTDWGTYGMASAPQTGWGAPYGMTSPPQKGWGAPYGMTSPPRTGWDQYGVNTNSYTYYMKRSSPAVQSVIYEEPKVSLAAAQLPDSSFTNSNSYSSYPYENGGFFGFPMGSPRRRPNENPQPSPPAGPPPPPSPKVSAWEFLNPFDSYDNGYPGYISQGRYGYGSSASSPDSNEVREREGIPPLEDETENESFREVHKGKKLSEDLKKNSGQGTSKTVPLQNSEGSSRAVPFHSSEGSARAMPFHSSEGSTMALPSQNSEGISRPEPSQNSEAPQSVNVKEQKSSPDSVVSKSTEDAHVGRKGVSFEVEEASTHDVDSLKLSSSTTLSAHGTRDLQEVVAEIRDEFEIASSYGKEVALILEIGRLPYQPSFSVFKVILSRILYLIAPSMSSSHPPSRRSARLAFSTMKLAKSYYGDSGQDVNTRSSNLSSTLERLYAWEKKLYKEVKDEERLRVIYERECKRLKVLDERGAESRKIDATQASIRKLLTKLNVCIKAVDAISSRIHKLRDEELQPQVTALIHGLIKMWKSMLKCHQKQFHAIMESKTRSLKGNTGFRRESSLRATVELEMELLTWCSRFSDWINTQKSFIDSLNGWLLNCLLYVPEETPDGRAPYSPGRIGAPPIFVISHDWSEAVKTISDEGVATAMRNFASSLHQLWERQDEEQRQGLKAEYLSKDFERRLRTLSMERGRMEKDQDAVSDKTGVSIVPSESGVSPLDDLKVDLDSIRKRLDEERARHKDAVKLVHNAASSSLQAGLIPIFEALENFTSEALKAYEQVRLQNAVQGAEVK